MQWCAWVGLLGHRPSLVSRDGGSVAQQCIVSRAVCVSLSAHCSFTHTHAPRLASVVLSLSLSLSLSRSVMSSFVDRRGVESMSICPIIHIGLVRPSLFSSFSSLSLSLFFSCFLSVCPLIQSTPLFVSSSSSSSSPPPLLFHLGPSSLPSLSLFHSFFFGTRLGPDSNGTCSCPTEKQNRTATHSSSSLSNRHHPPRPMSIPFSFISIPSSPFTVHRLLSLPLQ